MFRLEQHRGGAEANSAGQGGVEGDEVRAAGDRFNAIGAVEEDQAVHVRQNGRVAQIGGARPAGIGGTGSEVSDGDSRNGQFPGEGQELGGTLTG
ncbi:hypothetical protein QMK19_38605 [Streptomyces sp. H10-C2]|uniref:hypothetical protein n=1 Tax=unclassified Streptomyces TaxID=2593676 RepID=UPI0024B89FE9|nr:MULTISPECIES: hypothetical protein [unclassified Streptomyces]MDJ0346824.1 hypothetical protein [Streptomyces sp. PH10-H1]MDJ0375351.1 hypothetical protein [Streptomyces sp. H10-C2]